MDLLIVFIIGLAATMKITLWSLDVGHNNDKEDYNIQRSKSELGNDLF